MDFAAIADDPTFFAVLVGHVVAILLAVLLTILRKYGIGGFLAWVATVVSLVLGVLWFLILGGGRGNNHADQSVQMALDPRGGLWITAYIVVTLILGYSLTWVCKRGRARSYASTGAVAS